MKKIKLLKRKNIHLSKKIKTLLLNKKIIYEGEIDQLNRPSGFGCMIKFNQDISRVSKKGLIN